MNRKDYYFLGFHLILRGYKETPQYGTLLWSSNREHTLDIWAHRTLITLRRYRV
jgi:hypothetical protein